MVLKTALELRETVMRPRYELSEWDKILQFLRANVIYALYSRNSGKVTWEVKIMNTTAKSLHRWIWITLFIGLFSAPAYAVGVYGNAVVEQGEMLILRNGEGLLIQSSPKPVEVMEEDLLRVRPNSKVVLNSKEKAVITLGANSVFHVKPWEKKEESGFTRMLFGRIRASVIGLVGGERFNMKTATATIGVKGTDYRTAVAPQGEVLVISEDHTPTLQGPFGAVQEIGEGKMSFAAQNIAATEPVDVPEEITKEFPHDNLNSDVANSLAAAKIPGEEIMIQAGIISQTQSEGSHEDDFNDGGSSDALERMPRLEIDIDNALDNLYRGNLQLIFQ